MLVSLRFLLSVVGFVFVAVTGAFGLIIAWHEAMQTLDPVAENLRSEVMNSLRERIISVTDGVQQLSMRGAKGPVGQSNFGCCTPESDNAKSLEHFHAVRRYHWTNLETNPNLLLSYSGTMAGALILYSKTGNMADIDSTQARQGRGNMKWTLSDSTTQYRYHQWYSNSWTDGGYMRSQASVCGAGQVNTTVLAHARELVSQAQCDEAAAVLVSAAPNSTALANRSAPRGCFVDAATSAVFWNPSGDAGLAATSSQALCRGHDWFKRDRIFQPNCSHAWPCLDGRFAPVVEEGFDSGLFNAKSSLYNATKRSWWKGAVSNGDPSGRNCARFAGCRDQPGWSTVYLSKSAEELVLPSVFPLYVGSSDTVRAVITLCIGLRFLDDFIEESVRRISPDAQAWIIDLHPSTKKLGGLMASSPKGLSTSRPQDKNSVSGSLNPTFAVNAMTAGPHGAHVQAVSRILVGRTPSGSLLELPDEIQFTHDGEHPLQTEYLVQAKRIRDNYGLEWLIVLSVPAKVFVGDLPHARDTTIGLVCGISIGMAILLFALTCVVSQNLTTLGARMAEVADMKLDRVADKRISPYSEVSGMESSFKVMSGKLKEFWDSEQARLYKLEDERQRRIDSAVENAVMQVDTLGHPMVLCNARVFFEMGRLLSYETLRDDGKLVVLDTMERVQAFAAAHVIVFLSHQWLAWGDPDPENLHHRTMCNAVAQIQKLMANPAPGGGPLCLDDMYVWVDYGSVAQEHRGMQLMAISSLTVYSSVAHAFIVICPEATHAQSGRTCNLVSYDARGWCRCETMSKICGSGLENMYMMDTVDGDLKPLTLEVLNSDLSLLLFEGDFSCCKMCHRNSTYCDREHLMPSVLSLYAKLLMHADEEKYAVVLRHVEKLKDRFFPAKFTFRKEGGVEEDRELFGELVPALERYMEAPWRL